MKSVQISLLLILIPIVKGHFNEIQCYVCDDCDVFDDCLLQSCPQITISTTSSTTTKQTTRVPETPSAMPTATAPPTSSIRPSTSATTTVATTTYPASSEKTTQPMTSPAATWTTTEPTSISTEILETSDTAAAEDATTTKVPSSTTSETAEQTIDESTLQPEQSTGNVVNGLETAFSYKSVLLHWPVFSYHCYSIDIVENNKNKQRRGCVKVPVNRSGCTVLKDEFGCSATNCKLCSFDRCNSCRVLKYSMLALLICIVIGFILK